MPFIIGHHGDPHVAAVADLLEDPRILDASTLTAHDYLLTPDQFTFDGLHASTSNQARGWIRRLAPPAWSHGTPAGSHASVVQGAQLSLLAAVTRTPGIEWLTPLDSLLIGESKLVQAQAAGKLSLRTPRTVVTNNRERAVEELGDEVVLKPLGPGQFTGEDGREAVVYATRVDLRDRNFADLGPAPFLVQELIPARRHLRVTTVAGDCWVAALEADRRPLDWRSQSDAHVSFVLDQQPSEDLVTAAVRLAAELGLGYSSQDWVESTEGDIAILDVNPGGQWLFLPEPIGRSVAAAIAAWLIGRPDVR